MLARCLEEANMKGRLCGYQVKIKINAFRLRGRMPLPVMASIEHPSAFPAIPIPEAPNYQVKPKVSQIFSAHALACTAEAKQIMETDLSHHYTVPLLARKVGFNSSSLQVCFKQQYGKTIFEFGQDVRLEHSKKLLLETDQTIQEIAEACGYPEQANFSTAFKKKYGVAPGRWRKGGHWK